MLKLCNALDNYIPKGNIDIYKEFQKSAQIKHILLMGNKLLEPILIHIHNMHNSNISI
jgi:hypothetical protein